VITFEDQRVRYQNSAEGPASSVTGYASTADQSIVARVREVAVGTGTQPWFGLFVRYRDANNYYYVTVRNSNEISLRRSLSGAVTVLDSAPFTVTTGSWYKLRLEAIQDQLRVYVDGRLSLEGTDASIGEGRYGDIMYKAATIYDDVTVTQP
jgi:pectate lyase